MFKKRIGITQKVLKHNQYNEFMDCLDIKWAKLLSNLGILPIPLPLLSSSSVKDLWKTLKLDGLILSGGNTLADYADNTDKPEDISPERDAFEKALLEMALLTCKPVLGVCRGLQIINIYYNGRLKKIKGHAGTRHPLITEASPYQFKIPKEVNSFHDFAVPRQYLGKGLISFAHDLKDNIEAFYHLKDKVMGIMWHPERENIPLKSDCELIKRHFKV